MMYEVLSLALPEMKPELLTNSIKFEKENVQVFVYFSKNNSFKIEIKVNEESISYLEKISDQWQNLLVPIFNNLEKEKAEKILKNKNLSVTNKHLKTLKQKNKTIVISKDNQSQEQYIVIHKEINSKYFNCFLVEYSIEVSRIWDDNSQKFIPKVSYMKTLISSKEQKKFPSLTLYTKLPTIDKKPITIENNDINRMQEFKNLPDSFLNQFILAIHLENTIEEKMVKKKKKL